MCVLACARPCYLGVWVTDTGDGYVAFSDIAAPPAVPSATADEADVQPADHAADGDPDANIDADVGTDGAT